jgi:hypothetical protein
MPRKAAEGRFYDTCVRRGRRELAGRGAAGGVAVQSMCITAGMAAWLG